ncbi:MAG: DUF2256 domain-containing protein [Planctomycetota bacterium]
MPNSKEDLPEKDCIICQRPFRWRKKWAKVWEQVRYCSERCRRSRNTMKSSRPDVPSESSTSK